MRSSANVFEPTERWSELLHAMCLFLVYGCEAVTPLEIQMLSLCVALATEGDDDRLRLQKLKVLDEKQLQAQHCIKLYQARISKAFNKKVKERIFYKGDLVLAVRRPMVMTHKTKGKF